MRDFELSEHILYDVLCINRTMNSAVAADMDDVSRNIHWKLRSLEWDNLFNYGQGNRVDFDKLSGVVGIFGENYSGKSSTIDSLCYALFNNTTKNVRKSYSIINQSKNKCRAKAVIDIAGKDYIIERRSEKYVKRLKGEVTNEARTDVNFVSVEADGDHRELNGLTKSGTDKNIAKYFGTIDDFLLTSMSSQTDSLTFIKEGSTKRKEILAKFLDLNLFEEKFNFAKADASELKGLVKALEGKDYNNEIGSCAANLVRNKIVVEEHTDKCDNIKQEITKLEEEASQITSQINSVPAEIMDAEKAQKQISQLNEEIENLADSQDSIRMTRTKDSEELERISSFLSSFDIGEYKRAKEKIIKLDGELTILAGEEKTCNERLKVAKRKSTLLEEVPCGDSFLHCKLLKDATAAKGRLPDLEEKLYTITSQKENKQKRLNTLDPVTVDSNLDKYDHLIDKKLHIERGVAKASLVMEKMILEVSSKERHVADLKKDLKIYEDNREAIENLESLLKERLRKKKSISELAGGLTSCEEELLKLYKIHGSLEEKLSSLEADREMLHQKREEYAAYDYFLRCMHPHGISSDIVKRRLPVINAEIIKVLSNVVDFEIYMETDGRKLDVLIKHPKFEPRPIELGSGAEKTLAAIAIRLALLSVSTLPRGDIFILDEPGTALDENNMEGFNRIVDLIKIQFSKVILISHLDSLKDAADMTIDIERKGAFAHINQ